MFPEDRRELVDYCWTESRKTNIKGKKQVWAVEREAHGRSGRNIRGIQGVSQHQDTSPESGSQTLDGFRTSHCTCGGIISLRVEGGLGCEEHQWLISGDGPSGAFFIYFYLSHPPPSLHPLTPFRIQLWSRKIKCRYCVVCVWVG